VSGVLTETVKVTP